MTEVIEYHNWLDKLYERLQFEEHEPGKYQWHCGDRETGDRLAKAKLAAADIGGSFGDLMGEARRRSHVCCDCEIIFNCDDRPRE